MSYGGGFREIAVTIRAVNRASAEFNRIQTDAESLTARLKMVGAAVAGIGASGMAIGYLANQFGILNDAQAKVFNSAMLMVTVLGTFMQTSMGISVAQKAYAAACWVATAAQNALNISHATFLALTVVGLAVIAAATVAMFAFANSMNAATSSAQGLSSASGGVARGIQRAGESDLYRRGVE